MIFDASKTTPAPSATPPPYSAADAARVRALIAGLGLSQAEVGRAFGAEATGLSLWLRGIDSHLPSPGRGANSAVQPARGAAAAHGGADDPPSCV